MLSTHCFAHLAVLSFEIGFDWKLSFTRLFVLRLILLATRPLNFYFHLPKSKIYLAKEIRPGFFPALSTSQITSKCGKSKKYSHKPLPECFTESVNFSGVCHWCSYHILMSSVIYYWTDAQQRRIYLPHNT